ncbi:MAG: type II toxin-antitoxin system HipA family toxin [Acidobacteriota bacterium]
MDREALVHVDLEGTPHLVGRLWTRLRKDKESASFEYDAQWIRHPARFSLEPALTLGAGAFHTPAGVAMFGAIGDSAPDRWGRTLMRRMARRQAERAGLVVRTLQEMDCLLMVDDEARQGALRFAERTGGPFLREHDAQRIPPLIELPRLLAASERVIAEEDTDEDLRLLFAPGSSLGGARPKASVRLRDGSLAIAKFPRTDDEINTVRWESVALALAARGGIAVPAATVEDVAGKPVLIVTRFDRSGARRIPFLSAMSMLGARDNETHSYLEIVDVLRQHGAAPREDMEVLWRRIVFSVLISNTDDHLRNHAFLYAGQNGWRLSPAYDLNPVPTDIKARILTTAITEDDTTASLDLAFKAAGYFELTTDRARAIAKEVAASVSDWRAEAARQGLTRPQIERMASAFEHRDMERARSL